VWPESTPDAGDKTLYDLDTNMPSIIEVVAGTSFLTQISEIDSFPNGFAWAVPTVTSDCFSLIDTNVGSFNHGYSVWEI
jgi:hypothetical protein